MAWANGFGAAFIERLGWCLVHSVWQGAAVALMAAGVLRWLRQSSAQARYLTACGALLAMVALPVVTLISHGIRSHAEHGPSVTIDQSASIALPDSDSQSNRLESIQKQEYEVAADGVHAGIDQPHSAVRSALEPMLPWLVGAWASGVVGLSLRLLGGWVWIQWLVRRGSRPVEERWRTTLKTLQGRLRIGRPVRLVEAARLQVPLAVGWLRPVILLPVTALTALPSDQLEAILAHELAHIRRFDYLVNLCQSVVETFLFYHPAAWWISACIRAEREHCCDDCAIEVCGDRLVYARALTALEEQRGSGWLLAPSARDGSLLYRIRRLLGATSAVEKPAGGLAGTVVLATVVLLAVAFVLAPATNQAGAAVEPRDVITGSVVTADDKPVAAADVWLVAFSFQDRKVVTLGEARTDGDGHFRLVAIEERLNLPDLGWRSIYAYKPGMRPAAIDPANTASKLGVPAGVPVRLTLRAPVSTAFGVVDATGKPFIEARVAIVGLIDIRTGLPDELVNRMASQTGPDGRAILHGVPLDQIRELRVSAGSVGDQSFNVHNGFKADEVLHLRNAIPVVGRVVADDPALVRGLPVYLRTLGDGWRDLTRHLPMGEARTVTDDRGQFHVPALANGIFSASVRVPTQSLYRAPWINDRDLRRRLVSKLKSP
jgi:beta-lactamase regulating signal transducer with metallopeptidase domain